MQKVAVLGAGTMGHGIALVCASKGFQVALYDIKEEFLERGMQNIRAFLDKGVEKKKTSPQERETILGLIEKHLDLKEAVGQAAWVIEAAPESISLKREIFSALGSAAPREAILATNTSSLSVTEVAQASGRPERVVGLHFFNPPPLMELLEIVRGERTAPDVVEQAKALATRLGKEAILVEDIPGFATSRLGIVLGFEAIRMVEQGVGSPEDIDKAMTLGYRHPMGPLRLTDLVGLDVRLAIGEYLYAELGGEQYRPPALLRRMVRAGKLGKKTGEGFYRW